jgi:hypothetical protein
LESESERILRLRFSATPEAFESREPLRDLLEAGDPLLEAFEAGEPLFDRLDAAEPERCDAGDPLPLRDLPECLDAAEPDLELRGELRGVLRELEGLP